MLIEDIQVDDKDNQSPLGIIFPCNLKTITFKSTYINVNIILFSICQNRSHKQLIMLLSMSLTYSMTHKTT